MIERLDGGTMKKIRKLDKQKQLKNVIKVAESRAQNGDQGIKEARNLIANLEPACVVIEINHGQIPDPVPMKQSKN